MNSVLIYLNWPEKCFRVNGGDLSYLKSLLPKNSTIKTVKTDAAFLRALPRATHVITWHFKAEWYAHVPNLKLLATPAAGRELIAPVPEIFNFQSSIFNLQPSTFTLHFGHYHGAIMAESVAGFMLAWARGFFRKGPDDWPRTWLSDKCFTLAGTKAVIVGYGNVGRAIGEKLSALGVEVRGLTHRECDEVKGLRVESKGLRVESKGLKGVLGDADWFIMALPSTTGTDNFLDEKLLRLLPRKCVVVNVGRGNAIDEAALARALKAKRLAGAYLDVRKHEPSGTVPEFGANERALAQLDNVVLSPHSSAFSADYLKRCFAELKADGCLR